MGTGRVAGRTAMKLKRLADDRLPYRPKRLKIHLSLEEWSAIERASKGRSEAWALSVLLKAARSPARK
jgi:hypothetical protein